MRSLLIFLAALLLCAPAQAQVAGGDYDSDAQFYFDVLAANSCIATTPAFKLAVSHYIQAEKAAGNWGNQDAEYLLATTDSCTASVNLAQSALYQVTFSGACTFTVQNGLNGDAATCFGDTNVNQSALIRYTQNNAHFDVWVNSNAPSTNQLGVSGTGNSLTLNASTKLSVINSTAANGITDTPAAGLEYADRTGASTVNTGVNGVQTTAGGGASTALVAGDVLICKRNTGFCGAQTKILFVGFGAPMNSESSHYTNVRTMLLALGVTGI